MGSVSSPSVSSDRALKDPLDDRLGYAPFARQLATSVLKSSPSDGLVVAIYGPWGSGKSSALNFIVHYLERDPEEEPPVIVHFNPWWFSGHEDLLRRFFDQFRSSVAKGHTRRKKLLSRLAAFGEAVAEVPLPYAKLAGKTVQSVAQGIQTTDVVALKSELSEELKKTLSRVIVIIDDIDRLAKDEIRQLFRIVKAVADFPNVIYLLAFDRDIAAKALDESHGGSGSEYLEKIVQVPFELPPPEKEQIRALLFERLDVILAKVPSERFDQAHWAGVFRDGIEPFVEKPRDVVRLANTLSITFPAVAQEVDPVDFIAIETLRVFCPAAYEVVRRNPSRFTGARTFYGDGASERANAAKFHDAWLGQLGESQMVVKSLLLRLFPRLSSVWGNVIHSHEQLGEWRRRLKICSPDIFPVYFRLAVPASGVSNAELLSLFGLAEDAQAFAEAVRRLGVVKQTDGTARARVVLDHINDRIENQVNGRQAGAMIEALFFVGDDLMRADTRRAGIFDVDVREHLRFVLRRLLLALPAEERLAVLRGAITHGDALATIVHTTEYLEAQHGRSEEQDASINSPILDAAEVERLKVSASLRIRQFAEAGRLADVPDFGRALARHVFRVPSNGGLKTAFAPAR
jgi:predicted KAP-like P-loop ATPase